MTKKNQIKRANNCDLLPEVVTEDYIKDLEVFDAKIFYNEKVKGDKLQSDLDKFTLVGLTIANLLS